MDEFQRRIARLFNNPLHSDIKISAGDTVFHCHLVILSSCTNFFTAALKGDFVESSSKVVAFPEHDALTIRRMLDFCYTGSYTLAGYDEDFGEHFSKIQADDLPTPGYHFRVWALADYAGMEDLKFFAAQHLNNIVFSVDEEGHIPVEVKTYTGGLDDEHLRVLISVTDLEITEFLAIIEYVWNRTCDSLDEEYDYDYLKDRTASPNCSGNGSFVRWLLIRWVTYPPMKKRLRNDPVSKAKFRALLFGYPTFAAAIALAHWS